MLKKIGEDKVSKIDRFAKISRKTKETEVDITLNLDKYTQYKIGTPVGFLNHMLELFSKHSGFALNVSANGDIDIDYHHLVEDIGITLGRCFYQALGDKKGIKRYGFSIIPMDEVLVESAVDISGRCYLNYRAKLKNEKIGNFDIELVYEFFKAFAENARITIHIIEKYGENSHHIVEGIFKSFAYSMKDAVSIKNECIMSTKGVID